MNYFDFASKISFYEFYQEEFKELNFNVNDYKDEVNLLKGEINIDKLVKQLETNPKLFDIFECVLQLKRFTNAQYIHFCFDVNLLNNSKANLFLNYAEKSILTFENNSENLLFKKLLNWEQAKTETEKIFFIKRTISLYIDKILTDREYLYRHLQNSISTRLRFARYLIENLKADELLKTMDIEKFLLLKRIPIDVKSLHGNFGSYKIKQIFNHFNIQNVDNFIEDKILKSELDLPENFHNSFCYLSEKGVENIIKRKDKRNKIFDFILIYNKRPVVLIETNFYSTSGTKININQNEYIDLKEDIVNYSKNNQNKLIFCWITDGNYWLTNDGELRFKNLKQNYFKGDYELLNYNLFRELLPSLLSEIKTSV